MKRKTLAAVALLLVVCLLQSHSQTKKYYVDATGGSDANSGLSPTAAWKTIDKVNNSTFAPGDSILFKRGESFRGSLAPSSGSPSGYITYSAYGSGNKPKLLGAYDRSSPSDWTNQGGNIWRTKYRQVNLIGSELLPNPDFSVDLSGWAKYDDTSTGASTVFSRTTAAGEYFTPPGGARLVCINRGSNQWNSDIQVFTAVGSIKALSWYRLTFMAKATRPFSMPENKIALHQYGPPFTPYASTVAPPVAITSQWTSYEAYFHANATANDGRITFYFGNLMPNGDTLYFDALSFKECDSDPELLSVDVGNLILDNETSCGVRVWKESDLNAQGKFWYDQDNDLVKMYSAANPGSYYSHVELGLNRLCVLIDNRSYVACDNLDFRYGVFGVAGMNTHHVTIRNCDCSFIGGASQYGGSSTVRYGNGVQFWNAAHDNIVERCTFNQIYDAAVTAQGDDSAGFEVYNIFFRNNIIRNSEYSFEFWEGGSAARVHDVYFENNTCLNAGGGWGHSQRPNPNGTHLMFFPMFAQSANLFVRNNIFSTATDQCIRWWRKEDIGTVILDNNCWYQPAGVMLRIDIAAGIGQVDITYDYATQWEAYRTATKEDSSSIHADPLLNLDLSLQAASPCIDAGRTLSTVQTDFNGTVRPQGSVYDIGAYEAPASLIAPPLLIAPSDNTKKTSITPVLTWGKSRRATKYHLVVSTAPDFSGLSAVDTTIADTSRAIGPLQNGTVYYWRVQATNGSWASDWSQVRSFTTVAATPLGPAYYVSPNGNDSNPGTESLPFKTLAKAASMATAGVTVFIKQGTYNERLVPVNSGTADAPITFTSYPGDSVTISGVGMSPPPGWWAGLIWIQGLQFIKISGLRVIHSVNTGIDVENCSHITIEKTYVDSTYSPGIKVHACNDVVVQGNEVIHGCLGLEEECVSISATNFIEIRGNLVHDGMTEGIDVKVGSSNAVVTKNEVYNQGQDRSGIYVDAWDSHEVNIDIFDNISHNNGCGLSVGAEDDGLIEGIRMHHNKAYSNSRGVWVAGMGIGQKHLFNKIEICENEFHDNGFGIEIGGYTGTTFDSIKVYNNLIYRNKGVGIRITRYDGPSGDYAMRNVSIVNNTIYGNGTVGNGWGADNGGMNIFNVSPVNLLIRNNILSNNTICTIFVGPEVPAGSATIDYNLFDGLRSYPYETTGTNPVFGSPSFLDSLRNDYHLRSASPCIDKGHPSQEYNDPADPVRPGYALYPAQGTLRNDIGGYGGPYAGSVDVLVIAAPSAPTLAGPADSARNVPLSATLSWNWVLGATLYHLQLSIASDFGTTVVNDSTLSSALRSVGPLALATTYYWRVRAKNEGGWSAYSSARQFRTILTTSVEQLGSEIPKEYSLSQNYPNPFNPSTTIHYELSKSGNVSVRIFNILGQVVATLVDERKDAGFYQVQWNANVPSGIYFYRLQAGDFVDTKKMILLK